MSVVLKSTRKMTVKHWYFIGTFLVSKVLEKRHRNSRKCARKWPFWVQSVLAQNSRTCSTSTRQHINSRDQYYKKGHFCVKNKGQLQYPFRKNCGTQKNCLQPLFSCIAPENQFIPKPFMFNKPSWPSITKIWFKSIC